MTNDPANWHQALACVTGALVRGEQRITTHELLAVHLGVPITDQNGRRLRRVMRDLGWRGPRRMATGDIRLQDRLPSCRRSPSWRHLSRKGPWQLSSKR